MLHGWLVVNHFLHSAKFEEIYHWLIRAAADQNINLLRVTNVQLQADMNYNGLRNGRPAMEAAEIKFGAPDFVLFWDKDTILARYLENCGLRLFNRAESVEICDNKLLTHLVLNSAGLPMPRSIASPMTYDNIGFADFDFLESVSARLGYPMIIKAAKGSFGQQVMLANNHEELVDSVRSLGLQPIVFQEFIESSKGRDLRLQIVGDEVIAAMTRTSTNGDFRANLTLGGSMQACEPTEQQVLLALSACRKLQLDFAGVDLLFGKDEEPLICEVNSNAHFKTIFECTGVDTAVSIMNHIRSCQGGTR